MLLVEMCITDKEVETKKIKSRRYYVIVTMMSKQSVVHVSEKQSREAAVSDRVGYMYGR